jgi:predicted RND superfamily exporter protein
VSAVIDGIVQKQIAGYLSLFGINIDGVSLIAILLTIGVSVDYTSHVSYHYFITQLPPNATVEDSIDRLRWERKRIDAI